MYVGDIYDEVNIYDIKVKVGYLDKEGNHQEDGVQEQSAPYIYYINT